MKPQTPPTSTEYVEPLGFKGTKGIWQPSYNDKAIVNGDKPQDNELICSIAGHTDHEETRANRKLISQSKELAKALQDELLNLRNWRNKHSLPTEVDKDIFMAINKIEQVLKQAGLTE